MTKTVQNIEQWLHLLIFIYLFFTWLACALATQEFPTDASLRRTTQTTSGTTLSQIHAKITKEQKKSK